MDLDKMRVVVVWPQPTSRVQLQLFMTFANFYCRFIRGYSTLASYLSAFTSPKVQFMCSPAAAHPPYLLSSSYTSLGY
jgi:hypothetical protein